MQLVPFRFDPLGLFIELDYFSRAYVTGLLGVAAWSVVTFTRLLVITRRPSVSCAATVAKITRNLESLFCLSTILAVACRASMILAVCRAYIIYRATDGDWMSVLNARGARRSGWPRGSRRTASLR
jgi:hypothetical protein